METNKTWKDMLIRVTEKVLSREFILLMLCSIALILKAIDITTFTAMLAAGMAVLTGKKAIDRQMVK